MTGLIFLVVWSISKATVLVCTGQPIKHNKLLHIASPKPPEAMDVPYLLGHRLAPHHSPKQSRPVRCSRGSHPKHWSSPRPCPTHTAPSFHRSPTSRKSSWSPGSVSFSMVLEMLELCKEKGKFQRFKGFYLEGWRCFTLTSAHDGVLDDLQWRWTGKQNHFSCQKQTCNLQTKSLRNIAMSLGFSEYSFLTYHLCSVNTPQFWRV